MSGLINGLFTQTDRLQMESLNQRLTRQKIITGNVANAETPGFRALGYDFEEQLQALSGSDEPFPMKATQPKHFRDEFTEVDGTLSADVYVRPQESIPEDGNTVDVDKEMSELAQNQILYRSAAELINRKIGLVRYAISSGGR